MTLRSLTTLAVLLSLLVPTSTDAQRRRRRQPGPAAATQPEGARFQDPTEERSVDATDEDDESDDVTGSFAADTASLEDRSYLRERPDAVGEAAAAFRDQALERLIVEREGWVATRRTQAVALLEEFIRDEPESAPEMPDALLRLAELRWEIARIEYLERYRAWDAATTEGGRAARRAGAEPTPDYTACLALYDRILTRHRDFNRSDLVLYMKAFALVELGRSGEALDHYRRIIAEYPRSRFVPDAHFALAESHFTGSANYTEALAEYEHVLEHPGSELFDLSLFKSAWCLWRLARNDEAALRFRRVLDLGRQRAGLSAARRRRLSELQDEALDYLIQVFIEDDTNTAQGVFAFLEEIGGERYANRVLRRLSDTYLDQSRYERAIEGYQLLLQMDPTVEDAPVFQRRIARAHAAVDDAPATIEAYRVLAENYAPDSTWASQQGDPEVVRRAQRRGERSIRRQALRYHQEAQREDQQVRFEQAEALYGIHLANYPDAAQRYELTFYRAEILFHRLERYPEAGDAYLAAAREDPQGRYTRDALYNAIGAYERVREVEINACVEGGAGSAGGAEGAEGRSSENAGPDAGRAACAETDNDRKFGEAIELYVELFPEDPDLPEILFRQGRLYYDRRIYDPAVRLFGQLLERFPTSQFAEPAGELILDSFNRAQDYENIERWARRLKSAPAFASAEKQQRLDGLILQSIFRIGEQYAERGEHGPAADAYFRAAEEFPEDDRARQAYFNAGVERQRGGDLSGADTAYQRLIDRYPGSEEGARGAWAAAQMYESIAQFSDAARFYEAYAEHFPRGPQATDALYNAVLLRVSAGDNSDAVRDGQLFLERHRRHESADDVSFFIGRAHEGAEDWDDAVTVYRAYAGRTRNIDRKIEAYVRMGQALARSGDASGANDAYDQAVRTATRGRRRVEDGLYYAAQARFLQGQSVIARYAAIEIAGPAEGLRDRLQQKSDLLREAALIYADVVQFGVPEWVTAALYQIGRSYELFALALRAFEIPEGLTEDEEIAYQDQLDVFIIPMEDRALDAYDGGYQRAIEMRIFNRWTAALREGLTRINDVEYPPLREIGAGISEDAPLPAPEPLDGLRRDASSSNGDEDDDE